MSAGWRVIPHPADVGVEAWGPDEAALQDAAVRGLAEVLTGGAIPAAAQSRPLAAAGATAEERLVRTLEACLIELDCDDWLAVGVSGGALVGAPLSAEAREAGTHVKAVTWHDLAVERRPDGLHAVIVFDL